MLQVSAPFAAPLANPAPPLRTAACFMPSAPASSLNPSIRNLTLCCGKGNAETAFDLWLCYLELDDESGYERNPVNVLDQPQNAGRGRSGRTARHSEHRNRFTERLLS